MLAYPLKAVNQRRRQARFAYKLKKERDMGIVEERTGRVKLLTIKFASGCNFVFAGQAAAQSCARSRCIVGSWDKTRGALVRDILSRAYVFVLLPH